MFVIIFCLIFLCVAMWILDKMSEWSKKVHYIEENGMTICGRIKDKVTQDENKVTCKRCLYSLEKRRRKNGI